MNVLSTMDRSKIMVCRIERARLFCSAIKQSHVLTHLTSLLEATVLSEKTLALSYIIDVDGVQHLCGLQNASNGEERHCSFF